MKRDSGDMTLAVLEPDWPAPARVRAFCTTRAGGCSSGPWSSLNLGEQCGDDPGRVRRNRELLARSLPETPQWLRQVHGAGVALHSGRPGAAPEADALVAFAPNRVCAVLTADCLPVTFCDRPGRRVGLAHAGWRGLAAGVLEATVEALDADPGELLAWLGPAIGPSIYEVGQEVADAFPGEFSGAFSRGGRPGHWLLDLYAAARMALKACGVTSVYGGGLCTFSDPVRYFSYRRDGTTGRMATVVWME